MTSNHSTETLDAYALDAVARVVRILLLCGYSRDAIRNGVTAAFDSVPNGVKPLPPDAEREVPEAAHVLTLWHTETLYVDRKGKPRKLRRKGAAPSFESLAHSVNASLDLERLLKYLMQSRAVRKHGDFYVPTRRTVVLRGIAGPATFRNVRGLSLMLKTNEYNLTPSKEPQGWFERNAENPHFPERMLPDFASMLDREGMAMLGRIDAYMRGCEATRHPGEPTVKLGVGVFRYQEDDNRAP